MSETSGSESSLSPLSPIAAPSPATDGAAREGNGIAEEGMLDVDPDSPMEVDVEEMPVPSSHQGFQVFLQHANLHNLLQVESLSRTTGVFRVTSHERTGYLHLDQGELIHAEYGALLGEAAAAEILSWEEGEFKSCSRALSPVVTIGASLQSFLLRLAAARDEVTESERRAQPPARALREEDKPTQPQHTAPSPPEAQRTSSPPLQPELQRASSPPPAPEAQRTSSPPPPRSHRMPPLPPPRVERDATSVAEVTISAAGEVLQSRGGATEEFSSRVAYAARLAELIGRAIRSGNPRGLELRAKGTQTTVRWQPDGTLTATLDNIQPGKR